jgi:hypothetical protein
MGLVSRAVYNGGRHVIGYVNNNDEHSSALAHGKNSPKLCKIMTKRVGLVASSGANVI